MLKSITNLFSSNNHEYQEVNLDETPKPRNAPRGNSSVFAFTLVAILIILTAFAYSLNFFTTSSSIPEQPPSVPNVPIDYVEGDFREATTPYSVVDPRSLKVLQVDRTPESKPSAIFGDLRGTKLPLPTNSWCQNFLLGKGNKTDVTNKAFVLPYIIEAYHYIQGIRTHPVRIKGSARSVLLLEEEANGMAIGAVEEFFPHELAPDKNLAIGRLSIVLQWKSRAFKDTKRGPMMYTPIVRGSPYTSMVYSQATPRFYVQRSISHDVIVDNNESGPRLVCGNGYNVFSETPILVKRELKVQFEVSDMTWIIFVSEPTYFICSNLYFSTSNPPGTGKEHQEPHFDLRAVNPMVKGMVRIAMVNNCTTGKHHAQLCESDDGTPRVNNDFQELIRRHSDVYASGMADIQFVFPANPQEEDILLLKFDWAPGLMSRIHLLGPDQFVEIGPAAGIAPDGAELLMYAIPHHQERMQSITGSTNQVLTIGCSPTLHGLACPVLGRKWALLEHLHRVNFNAPRTPRVEMIDGIKKALDVDIEFAPPLNYMRGAGDTYFSGKIIAKLARILLIADEVGYDSDPRFDEALDRLRQATEIWLNSTAESPLLYDRSWGGIVMCGCDYNGDDGGHCNNHFPNCPALEDQGQNFGAGFYNDHHFHFGYHIYAAAVISKYDHVWAKKYWQHVLLLVRDIANPSPQDPFFPTWRHKDWYLGFSWASGIVTANGLPYPNGRNQESVSESINAYESLSLYGAVMSQVFEGSRAPSDIKNHRIAERISDMGRLLYATETRSAKTYWHVQAPQEGVARIYPEVYTPKVVGMVWSLLAQEQTWFGNEPYKSYGIQLMPITPGTELRDTPGWIQEMLPYFKSSCDDYPSCTADGWSILIYICQATLGDWLTAWKNVESLSDDVYISAGGNGHSKTNTLWYIATRPHGWSIDSNLKEN